MLRFRRVGAAFVAGVYFLTNVMATHAVEKSLWEERRAALDGAPRYARLFSPAQSPRLWDSTVFDGGSSTSQPPSIFKNLALPFDVASAVLPYGAIGEVRPGRPRSPVVFLVQDVHGNNGAQKNIGGLLGELSAHGVTLTGVEGAWVPFDLSAYHRHPSPKAVSLVAEALRDSGRLSGSEWAGLTAAHPPTLVGVESPDLYHANVAAARECVARRPAVASFLASLNKTLQFHKERDYSPALKTFDLHLTEYHNGREGLAAYARFLSGLPGGTTHAGAQVKKFLNAMEWESRLNFDTIEADRRALMDRLANNLDEQALKALLSQAVSYRAGQQTNGDFFSYLKTLCAKTNISLASYRSFADYVAYVGLVQSIRRADLLDELTHWETARGSRLAKTPEEQCVLVLDRDAALLRQLLENEMSPEAWAQFTKRRNAIVSLPARLRERGDFQEPQGGLAAFFRPHEEFCRLAMERNGALVSNFMRQVETQKAHRAVLVTGGFHTPGLQSELQKHGYSTVVVTPRIEKVEGKPLDVFARDPLPFDQLFAGKLISLSPELMMALRSRLFDLAVTAKALAENEMEDVKKWAEDRDIQVREASREKGVFKIKFDLAGKSIDVAVGPPDNLAPSFAGGAVLCEPITFPNGQVLKIYANTHSKSNKNKTSRMRFLLLNFQKVLKFLFEGIGNPRPKESTGNVIAFNQLMSLFFLPFTLAGKIWVIPEGRLIQISKMALVQEKGSNRWEIKDKNTPVGNLTFIETGKNILLISINVFAKGNGYGSYAVKEVAKRAARILNPDQNQYGRPIPLIIYQVENPVLFQLLRDIFKPGTMEITLSRSGSSVRPDTVWRNPFCESDPNFKSLTGNGNIDSKSGFYCSYFNVRGELRPEFETKKSNLPEKESRETGRLAIVPSVSQNAPVENSYRISREGIGTSLKMLDPQGRAIGKAVFFGKRGEITVTGVEIRSDERGVALALLREVARFGLFEGGDGRVLIRGTNNKEIVKAAMALFDAESLLVAPHRFDRVVKNSHWKDRIFLERYDAFFEEMEHLKKPMDVSGVLSREARRILWPGDRASRDVVEMKPEGFRQVTLDSRDRMFDVRDEEGNPVGRAICSLTSKSLSLKWIDARPGGIGWGKAALLAVAVEASRILTPQHNRNGRPVPLEVENIKDQRTTDILLKYVYKPGTVEAFPTQTDFSLMGSGAPINWNEAITENDSRFQLLVHPPAGAEWHGYHLRGELRDYIYALAKSQYQVRRPMNNLYFLPFGISFDPMVGFVLAVLFVGAMLYRDVILQWMVSILLDSLGLGKYIDSDGSTKYRELILAMVHQAKRFALLVKHSISDLFNFFLKHFVEPMRSLFSYLSPYVIPLHYFAVPEIPHGNSLSGTSKNPFSPKKIREMLQEFEANEKEKEHILSAYVLGGAWDIHTDPIPETIDLIFQIPPQDVKHWKERFLKFLNREGSGIHAVDLGVEEEGTDFSFSMTVGRQTIKIEGSAGSSPFWEQLVAYVLAGRTITNNDLKARRILIGRFFWPSLLDQQRSLSEVSEIIKLPPRDSSRIELGKEIGNLFKRIAIAPTMDEISSFYSWEKKSLEISAPPIEQDQGIDFFSFLAKIVRSFEIAGPGFESQPISSETSTLVYEANSGASGDLRVSRGGTEWVFWGLTPSTNYTLRFSADFRGRPTVNASVNETHPVVFVISEGRKISKGYGFTKSRETAGPERMPLARKGDPNIIKMASLLTEALLADSDLKEDQFEALLRKKNLFPEGRVTVPLPASRTMELTVFEGKRVGFRNGLSGLQGPPVTVEYQWMKGVGLILYIIDAHRRACVYSFCNFRQKWAEKAGETLYADLLETRENFTFESDKKQVINDIQLRRLVADFFSVDPLSVSEEDQLSAIARIEELAKSAPITLSGSPVSGKRTFLDPLTGLRFVLDLRSFGKGPAEVTPVWDDLLGLVLKIDINGRKAFYDFGNVRENPQRDPLFFELSRQAPQMETLARNRSARHNMAVVLGHCLGEMKNSVSRPSERLEREMAWFRKVVVPFQTGESGILRIYVPMEGGAPLPVLFTHLPLNKNGRFRLEWVSDRGPVLYFEGKSGVFAYGLGDARWAREGQKTVNANRLFSGENVPETLAEAQNRIRTSPANFFAQALAWTTESSETLVQINRRLGQSLSRLAEEHGIPEAPQRNGWRIFDPLSGITYEFPGSGDRKHVTEMGIRIESPGKVSVRLNFVTADFGGQSILDYTLTAPGEASNHCINAVAKKINQGHSSANHLFFLPLGIPFDPLLGLTVATLILAAMLFKTEIMKLLAPPRLCEFLNEMIPSFHLWGALRPVGQAVDPLTSAHSDSGIRVIGRPVNDTLNSQDRQAFAEALGKLLSGSFDMRGVEAMIDPHQLAKGERSAERLQGLLNLKGNSLWEVPDELMEGVVRHDPESILRMRLFASHPLGVQALASRILSATKSGDAKSAGAALAAWDDSKFLPGPNPEIVAETLAVLFGSNTKPSETVSTEFAEAYNHARSGLLFPKLIGGQLSGSQTATGSATGIVLNLSALFDETASDALKGQTWLSLASALVPLERAPNTPLALVVFGENNTRAQVEQILSLGLPKVATEVLRSNLFVEGDARQAKFFVEGKFSLRSLQRRPQWQRDLKVLGFTEETLLKDPQWAVELIPLEANRVSDLRRILDLLRFIKVSA